MRRVQESFVWEIKAWKRRPMMHGAVPMAIRISDVPGSA